MKITSHEYGNPFARDRKQLEGTIDGARTAYVAEIDGYGSELAAIEKAWKRLRGDWRAKRIDEPTFTSKAKAIEARLKANTERREIIERHKDALISAQGKMLDSYDQEESAVHEKMRALTSYLVASHRDTPAIKYLHDELCAYRDSKDRAERRGISATISSIFASASEFNPAEPESRVLRDFAAISDPEEKSKFYHAHRAELMAAHDSQTLKDQDEISNP